MKKYDEKILKNSVKINKNSQLAVLQGTLKTIWKEKKKL